MIHSSNLNVVSLGSLRGHLRLLLLLLFLLNEPLFSLVALPGRGPLAGARAGFRGARVLRRPSERPLFLLLSVRLHRGDEHLVEHFTELFRVTHSR